MASLSGIPLTELWNKYSETGFCFLDGGDMFTFLDDSGPA